MATPSENMEHPNREVNSKVARIVIYPKDIQRLTGKSYRHALDLNKEIRDYFKKQKHHLLTAYEFGEYTGIQPEIILQHLK